MDWFIWTILLLIVIFGLIRMFKKSENKAATFLVLFIFIIVYFHYFLIDRLFKTDIFTAFTFQKNGGFSISFIGMILLVGTTVFITYVISKYIDKRKR